MGLSIKRPIRDILVNDSTMRGFFNATLTSSARVFPVYMELSGRYPQVIYSETPGRTDPGMSGTNGILTLSIETQATGGVNPHIAQENILERIDQLIDDLPLTGVAISGTAVNIYLMLREGGTEINYIDSRKVYQRFITYSYRMLKD